jgi:hypothetical protein
MPRPLQRIALEARLKLDSWRARFIIPGAISGPIGIRWRRSFHRR